MTRFRLRSELRGRRWYTGLDEDEIGAEDAWAADVAEYQAAHRPKTAETILEEVNADEMIPNSQKPAEWRRRLRRWTGGQGDD